MLTMAEAALRVLAFAPAAPALSAAQAAFLEAHVLPHVRLEQIVLISRTATNIQVRNVVTHHLVFRLRSHDKISAMYSRGESWRIASVPSL